MKATTKLFRIVPLLVVCASAVLLGTGCATNGRQILLKEYGPTGAPATELSLKGKTVCLKGFECASTLTKPDPKSKPEKPAQFKFVPFTAEQSKQWEGESKAKAKETTKSDWRDIGNIRNGYGIVMSHVYALNDPGVWLVETLRMDLESQGAKVVDASQADTADI
jgi:hypothetical protein